MKDIGGYFELELNKGEHYHVEASKLNLGRQALVIAIKLQKFTKVYLPWFTCDVITDALSKIGLIYEFYHINELLEPVFDFNDVKRNECIVITNYFALKRDYLDNLKDIDRNVIIDNAQDFFHIPKSGLISFNSARKFLGVPDGAYLYGQQLRLPKVEPMEVKGFLGHLFQRIEGDAYSGYNLFKENEVKYNKTPLHEMSNISKCILRSVDYKFVMRQRRLNFIELHKQLSKYNDLKIVKVKDTVPFTYPLYTSKGSKLREFLIANRVYTPTFWPNVLKWCQPNDFEYNLTLNLVHLPIDQRYGHNEMTHICKLVKSFFNE